MARASQTPQTLHMAAGCSSAGGRDSRPGMLGLAPCTAQAAYTAGGMQKGQKRKQGAITSFLQTLPPGCPSLAALATTASGAGGGGLGSWGALDGAHCSRRESGATGGGGDCAAGAAQRGATTEEQALDDLDYANRLVRGSAELRKGREGATSGNLRG